MSAEYDSQVSDKELVSFNRQFEAYAKTAEDKQPNTFFDVISVANLAYDVNEKNGNDENNCVKVYFYTTEKPEDNKVYSILPDSASPKKSKKNYFFKGKSVSDDTEYIYGELVQTFTAKKEEGDTKYQYIFPCELTYNSVTGKVDTVTFCTVENN